MLNNNHGIWLRGISYNNLLFKDMEILIIEQDKWLAWNPAKTRFGTLRGK